MNEGQIPNNFIYNLEKKLYGTTQDDGKKRINFIRKIELEQKSQESNKNP